MKNPDTVTASEIGDFVYRAEAWRRSALGHQSKNRDVQQAGMARHSTKATAERVAGSSIALDRILIIVALLAPVAWMLSR